MINDMSLLISNNCVDIATNEVLDSSLSACKVLLVDDEPSVHFEPELTGLLFKHLDEFLAIRENIIRQFSK